MDKDTDGKLFAAALYVITDMWGKEMGDLQRASLANQIVREIERRGIVKPAAAAEPPSSGDGANTDYVMVPRKASDEMVEQARMTLPGIVDICDADIEDIYETMLSAAPPWSDDGETFGSVPKTPSKEMIEAGASVFSQDGFPDQAFADDARAYYEAMIAAAPPWKPHGFSSAAAVLEEIDAHLDAQVYGLRGGTAKGMRDADLDLPSAFEHDVIITEALWDKIRKALRDAAPPLEVGEMVERLKNEVDGGVMDTSTSDAIFAAVSLLIALDAERGRMREALRDLLTVTDPAGMTEEIIADKEKFARFLDDCERSTKAAVDRARSAVTPNPPEAS